MDIHYIIILFYVLVFITLFFLTDAWKASKVTRQLLDKAIVSTEIIKQVQEETVEELLRNNDPLDAEFRKLELEIKQRDCDHFSQIKVETFGGATIIRCINCGKAIL